jgi:branched-chain amino acid transport system substrate-binding protein
MSIHRRQVLRGGAGLVALGLAPCALTSGLVASRALAQDTRPVRIGLIAPLTGPFTSTGRMLEQGARLYMAQAGDTVAGRKVELVVKDDTGIADVSKRLAQDLVIGDKVDVLAGFGLTPLALATAPVATQAKVPMLVMMAATPVVTERSPFIVRTAFTTRQTVLPLADWTLRSNVRTVVTLVSDYAPGVDTELAFVERFRAGGGEIVTSIRVPLADRDFSPYLQRVADMKPDALFVFVPTGVGTVLTKQYAERGLAKAGIRLIGEGSVTEDDSLGQMDDSVLGMVTSHHYSAAHDSPENKAFVAAFRAAYGTRPNLVAVHAFDGMHLVYEALRKTQGKTDGTELVAAMKGMSWTSPRGPVSIDPQAREMVQNVYIRRVERRDGELWNAEFETIVDVRDFAPAK